MAVSVAARSAWRVARAGPTSSITIATDRVTRVSISSGCRNRARTSIRGHSATHSVQCSAPSTSRRPQCSSRAVGVAVCGAIPGSPSGRVRVGVGAGGAPTGHSPRGPRRRRRRG